MSFSHKERALALIATFSRLTVAFRPHQPTGFSRWSLSMITNGEQKIEKVLAIMPNGKSGAPCGACRELMVQLMPNSYQEIEVLMDFETEEIVTLGELTPKWWI